MEPVPNCYNAFMGPIPEKSNCADRSIALAQLAVGRFGGDLLRVAVLLRCLLSSTALEYRPGI